MTDRTQPASQEAALVVLAQAGSDAAFEELVRRRHRTVRGLLGRVSGDPALGDDLAQEAFMHAWKNLRQLRAPAAFGPWLRQIALNTWLQHARRVRIPMDDLAREEMAADSDAPDVTRRVDLERALAKLRPPERLCVVLAYAEGMSHGEIARATGMPLGTVKSHISRGAARLRGWLVGDTVNQSIHRCRVNHGE